MKEEGIRNFPRAWIEWSRIHDALFEYASKIRSCRATPPVRFRSFEMEFSADRNKNSALLIQRNRRKKVVPTALIAVFFIASVGGAFGGGVSCGPQVKGQGHGVAKLIKRAWDHGAYKCAPKDLTLAEAHLRFARDRLSQGKYFNAKEHMTLAEHHVREALRKSPKERCAPREIVEAPLPRPVKAEVKFVDRDGDGIPDHLDKCPGEAEDFDGFEDEDGCPEPDNDGDGICDPNPVIQARLAHWEATGVCRGKDKCPGMDPDKLSDFIRTREDFDGFEDEDGCPEPDNDGDGICDPNPVIQAGLAHWEATGVCRGKDKCPGADGDKANDFAATREDFDGFEDEDGCPEPDNDGDGICDDNPEIQNNLDYWESVDACTGKDLCPGKDEDKANDFADVRGGKFNPHKQEDGCPVKLKLIVVTKKRIELKQKVYFEFDRARIQEVSFPLLNEVASVLKDRPTMRVRIEGHTDSRGRRAYNLRLSRRRANSVRQYLIEQGVSGDRMEAQGYGMSRPIATNRTEEGRDKNRRVEFHIIQR